jgi:hypothetical protein
LGGVKEDGGARGDGIYARTLVFLAARARWAAAPARPGRRSGMHWRVVLLGLSAAGSLASIACLLTGNTMLALRMFIATLVVLGTLLLQALL